MRAGFTLIELILIIAILGVLAGIAVPLITSYLGGAKERAWAADRDQIQAAVDAYYGSPTNVRHGGQRQYPIKGMHADGALKPWNDADSNTALPSPGNPLRGTRGGDPKWRDGGDGIRNEENLNAEAQTIAGSGAGWYVFQVNLQGTDYAVDSRNFFIDLDSLGTALKSASPDNKEGATGSYSWYVDANGRVSSLYYHFPTNGAGPGANNGPDNRGFISGVYP